jgi:hypothetical protein
VSAKILAFTAVAVTCVGGTVGALMTLHESPKQATMGCEMKKIVFTFAKPLQTKTEFADPVLRRIRLGGWSTQFK